MAAVRSEGSRYFIRITNNGQAVPSSHSRTGPRQSVTAPMLLDDTCAAYLASTP